MEKRIELEITLKRISGSGKAWLVEFEHPQTGKTGEEWLPVSQIIGSDCLAEGDEGVVEITEWIARQKELLEEDDA